MAGLLGFGLLGGAGLLDRVVGTVEAADGGVGGWAATRDIALGLNKIDGKPALDEFARQTGAYRDKAWQDLGFHNAPPNRFDIAFEQTLNKVVKGGGTIRFNLDSVDIPQALAGDPGMRVGRYTEWELQQIVRNQQWLDSTEFYLNGSKVSADQAKQLGLTHVP